jgi:hypothetical protein
LPNQHFGRHPGICVGGGFVSTAAVVGAAVAGTVATAPGVGVLDPDDPPQAATTLAKRIIAAVRRTGILRSLGDDRVIMHPFATRPANRRGLRCAQDNIAVIAMPITW